MQKISIETKTLISSLSQSVPKAEAGPMNDDFLYTYQVERFKSMGKNKQGQENENRATKAVWNKEMVHIFCDICIRAFQMGMRPGTHFTKQGWKYIIKHFQKESGQNFSKKQLKNKWDGSKKEWKLWKALISEETEIGWDPKKQTLEASDSWWDEKIKAMPAAKKFQNAGIEPELCAKYDVMFMDTGATGNCASTHSIVVLQNDKDGNDESPSNNVMPSESDKDGNEESPSSNDMQLEGSGYSRSEPNFVDSLEQIMDGANMSSAMLDGANVSSALPTQCIQATLDQDAMLLEGQRKERKQRRNDEFDIQVDMTKKLKLGRRQLEGLAKLSQQINRLMATVESSSVTSKRTDLPGCSIPEVLADLHSMPEIVKGSELHLFATDLFLSRAKREVYASLGESDVKLTWLKYQHAKSS
ncbi:hypothetical protein JCGZ_18882 [Jatropha curcas]|uniref:Myb/SANT-like domain-containing protein n=1 Tax=Jatropha curcas TaxID=180498 RepID=A0A067JV95_JATCU|nr:L10-interacting MYB domain-containing protein [Jatropha curcas]KDP27802.1 hypothetical protein JCGZ_18882 [Jatropha curcas]